MPIPPPALLIGALWLSYTLPAQAQTRPADNEKTQYTFVLTGVPLQEALHTLIDKTPISLIYETELVEGKTAFCHARDQTQEGVLRCILRGTGLDFARLSSGTYVLFGDPRTRPRYGRLAGQVTDADTGTPLADANILLAGEDTGTATNQAGRFAITSLKPGPHLLIATHVAYHDWADTVWVTPETTGRVTFSMKARTVLTAPVVISGFTSRLPSEDLGLGRRTAADLAQTLDPGDVVQDIDAIVGVRAGNALSDVHVQGGASGEHQYLLDGATVFVPIQNGGFFGPVSPYAVEQITVQKAGFDAAHGSHLSGVIEVDHRIAPAAKRELVLQADPLNANGRLSGKTTQKGRYQASWMAALRGSLWRFYQPQSLQDLFQTWGTTDHFLIDALSTPDGNVEPGTNVPAGPIAPVEVSFSDIHAAARLQRDGLHSLHASFYRGRNVFGNEQNDTESPEDEEDDIDDEYAWENMTTQFRYEGVLGSRAFASLGFWTSNYTFAHPFDLPLFGLIDPDSSGTPATEDANDIGETGLRAGWNYAATARHFLSGNLEAVHTSSEFVLSFDSLGTTVDPRLRRPARWRLSTFLEDRLALGHRVTLRLGTRLTYLPSLNSVYAEPRLAFQYDHPKGRGGTWAFRGAVGLYRQFVNQFDVATNSTTALVPSVRFWLPVGIDGSPPKAYHLTGAILYRPDPAWQFSLESFYKHQPHLLVLDYPRLLGLDTGAPAAPSSNLLTGADGYAYGVAFSASRTTQKTRLAAQYEYAAARRRVPNRFEGAFVPVPWNTPHRFFVSIDVAPLAHLTATLRWQGIAGRAWGFRQAYYDYLEPNSNTQFFAPYDLSDPEAHRLPFFSQWDVGVAYSRTVGGLGFQARLNLINVLGRRNVRDWNLLYEETTTAYVRTARHATPFIPSLSLRMTW